MTEDNNVARIPGGAWRRAAEGDFLNDAPAHWRDLNEVAVERRFGRGTQYRVPVTEATRPALDDLRDYLDTVAGAMWSALPDQKGDQESYVSVRTEALTCTLACRRITEALGDDWKPRP